MPLRISLGQLLHDCAARFGERPCITMALSGETLSYAGLDSLVNRTAHGFRDGIAGGRLNAGSGHVAVMLENGIPYLAMSYALKKIDLVEVSINRAFIGYWGPGLFYPMHGHEAEEIYFVLIGRCLFEAEGDAPADLGPGGVKFHRSGQAHAMTMVGKGMLALCLWRSAGLADNAKLNAPPASS